MNQAMKDIRASSHSGESVSLVHYQDQLCVLKVSGPDPARFRQCIAKQKGFQALALSGLGVSAASIVQDIEEDGRAGVVMPYVHGLTGADFALHGNREIARDLARGLSALLIDAMSRSVVQPVPAAVFLDKLEQVLASNQEPCLKPCLERAWRWLNAALAEKPSLPVPMGECHGDLTLSNLILSHSKGIVLIDFLACFLESPLQDLAKIAQDFECGWSFRKLDSNLRIKAGIFAKLAYPGYAGQLYALFPTQAAVFKLLCLARIAPYVKDELTARWLENALGNLLDGLGAAP